MTAIIDGKYQSIHIINADYSETQSEVKIMSGNHKGVYCIVSKSDIRKKPTVRFSWGQITKDANGNIHQYHEKWIYLDTIVTVQTEDEGTDILNKFENYLKDEIGDVVLQRCPSWDEEKEYYDCFAFERDHGNVAEQKRVIMQVLKQAKKTLI